jgi:hypothetical protein
MPSEVLSEEDSIRNSCHYFIEAVRVLALAPDKQCEKYGNFNVAWELKDDVLAGRYLLGRKFLSPSQEAVIARILDALDAVDVRSLPGGVGREQNRKAMANPSWEPARELARRALPKLERVAAANAAYFRGNRAT